MLVVIAAGNSGPNPVERARSGTAKNCLTVGASESLRPLPSSIRQPANLAGHTTTTRRRRRSDVPRPSTASTPRRTTPTTSPTSRGAARSTTRRHPHQARPRRARHLHPVHPLQREHGRHHGHRWGQPPAGCRRRPARRPVLRYRSADRPVGAIRVRARPPARTTSTCPARAWRHRSSAEPAALLRQYLREHRGIANPSAALLRGADHQCGHRARRCIAHARQHSRLRLAEPRAAPHAPARRQRSGVRRRSSAWRVATNDVRTFSIQPVDTTRQPLRVTLAWTDPPEARAAEPPVPAAAAAWWGAADGRRHHAVPEPQQQRPAVHIDTPAAGHLDRPGATGRGPLRRPALDPALRQDFALAVSNATFV